MKSNIGHLDTAAGVASLIRAICALEEGVLPPALHFDAPNPEIDFEAGPFFVPTEAKAWSGNGAPRRAGVSSLGVGGTNAFAVLEEAPPVAAGPAGRPVELLVLSGRSRSVLEAAGADLSRFLELGAEAPDPAPPLADVAHTLARGRRAFRHRRAVTAASREEAVEALVTADPERIFSAEAAEGAPSVSFLFAGGGTQHPGMGARAYREERIYREVVDECLALLDPDRARELRHFLLEASPGSPAASAAMERPRLALPALFITQLARGRLWMSWGVRPDGMIGHSMGEYTAACLSGVMGVADALSVVVARARLFEAVPTGGMLGVSLGEEELRALLPEDVSLAAVNAPELCVASGPVAALEALEARLASLGVDHRRLRISVAAHSQVLDPILDEFHETVRAVALHPPRIPFVSSLSGDWITADEATDASYWVRQLRETVRFSAGVQRLTEAGHPLLLEVGPGRTLATLARANANRDRAPHIFTTEVQAGTRGAADGDADARARLSALGRLWALGVEVDWDAFYAGQKRRRVPLPTYPFEHRRYFVAPGRGAPLQPGSELASSGGGAAPGPAGGTAPAAGPAQDAPAASRTPDPLAGWFYRHGWEPAELEPDAGTAGPILVIGDGSPAAAALEAEIRGRGRDPVSVTLGCAFREEEGAFTVRAGEAEDFGRVLAALGAAGRTPTGAIHTALLGGPAADPHLPAGPPSPGDALPREGVDRAFHSLLALLAAREGESPDEPFALVVASTRMHRVEPGEPVDAWKALALGPVRVAPRELPSLRTRSVDVEAADPERPWDLAGLLLRELDAGDGERVVAYRGGARLGSRVVPLPLPPVSDDALGAEGRIRGDGSYLVTGGLGGLGLTVASYFASRGAQSLVLVGRSGLTDGSRDEAGSARARARLRTIREIEAMGCRVAVHAVDVTDAPAMEALVRAVEVEHGPIRGVVHAAGVLEDGPLLLKDREGTERVLAPKVAGTVALWRALAGQPLEFRVLFSSRSSVSGVAGQVDYTAANAFLDAWAQGGPVGTIAIGWDAWREVGMAADLARGEESAGEVGEDSESLEHPFFDRRTGKGTDEELLVGRFRQGRHWMLDEHRIRGGSALLPGAGFLEVIRAAVDSWSAAGGDPAVEGMQFEDVLFLEPFVVPDGAVREMGVRLRRTTSGLEVAVLGRMWQGSGAGGSAPAAPWKEHARARVVRLEPLGPGASGRPARTPLPALLERCGGRIVEVDGAPANPSLDFGPRWGNLVRIHEGKGEAILELALAEAWRADLALHPLHPALVDVATAGAQWLIPGFDPAHDFYVPASCAAFRYRAPLPPVLFSHVRLRESGEGMAVFDVVLLDEHGSEVAAADEFVMLGLDDPGRLDTTEWALEGIGTEEGVLAFDRILRSTGLPRAVAVVPGDLVGMLQALDREGAPDGVVGAGATAGAGKRNSAADRMTDVAPLVDALLAHPAIADAAAVAHPGGPGRPRIVAFMAYESGQPSTVSELRRFLRERIRDELVPQNFVEMPEIPRDARGEVERARLADPFAPRDDHVPPVTPTERTIAEIWSRLLGMDRIGLHDNFLDVGGHSLVGIRTLLQIEKRTGVRLHPNQLTLQTLEQLAAEVDRRAGNGSEDDEVPRRGLAGRLMGAVRRSVSGGGRSGEGTDR